MRTVLIVLILGLTASSVMSACASSFLVGLINFDTNKFVTTAVKATADGAKCGWVSGTTDICVAQADQTLLMTTIQTYISAERTALQDAAGDRDKYILEQRGKVIEVLGTLRKLNDLVDDAPANAQVVAELFGGFATEISKNFTAIVANLKEYQTSRATCIKDLLTAQSAVVCAGFQDNAVFATAPGANAGDIAIIDATINTLTSSCFAYMDNSATQSSIIYTNLYSKILSAIVTLLENPSDSSVSTIITDFGKITLPSSNYQIPSRLPTSCTSSTSPACRTFLETNYFSNGALNKDKIITGGETSQITFTRRLEGERRLATAGLTIDLTKFSFDTTFEENPGKIDNTKNANSALRNGIVACAVAALALVF